MVLIDVGQNLRPFDYRIERDLIRGIRECDFERSHWLSDP